MAGVAVEWHVFGTFVAKMKLFVLNIIINIEIKCTHLNEISIINFDLRVSN